MLMNISGETEEEFSTRLANNLEELILKEGPETVLLSHTWKVFFSYWNIGFTTDLYGFLLQIAAFIAEPVMGAGGVIPPPSTYFEKVFFHLHQCFRYVEFPASKLDSQGTASMSFVLLMHVHLYSQSRRHECISYKLCLNI